MSFRSRLTLFFVAIVIVPMVSVAFVLFSLIEDNENGKADARLEARQRVAVNLYQSDREAAGRLASRIGADRRLAAALRSGEDERATRRAEALLGELGAVRIRIEDRRGADRVDVGRDDAIAPARSSLVDEGGSTFGAITVSDRSAPVYARMIRRLTGMDVVVRDGGRTLASTLGDGAPATLPDLGDTTVDGRDFRVASFDATTRPAPGFAGDVRVSLLFSQEQVQADTARSRWLAGGVLAGFFLLAIMCAYLVSRSLQAQIAAFLDAARRIGRGDFTAKVPTQGRDEFAALGDEFNRMASQLQARLEELQTERLRLENSMQRLGEAFASNLDAEALLEIAVRTAVDGVDAEGGRAVLAGGDVVARFGAPAGLEALVEEAEREALEHEAASERVTGAGSVLVHPLAEAGGELVGSLSVWRTTGPFRDRERDLFHYLAGQAAISLDNVALHEAVQRQAVTDELTGLYNHRRFQEGLATEIERARRFGQGLGLVMLDIDNFKAVNDTYGHQVGDRVLAEVAGVLREYSREIDEPARYGGEELAVVLPGTDLEGAYNLAERVRAGIEALEFPLDGRGTLRVTASFGVAALPESAHDQSSLIAAADAALYEAKRSGKNRTVRAEPEHARRPR
jgi:diguanylate cyclase (GGDEF)-like protein